MLSPEAQDILLRRCLDALVELGLLQFDPLTGELIIWSWPLDTECGDLVPVYELDRYRAMKDFHYPSCFCSTPENPVVESAFFRPSEGPYKGFWIVGCAQNNGIGCSYFVPVERVYRWGQIPRQYYPSRTPAPVVRFSERCSGTPPLAPRQSRTRTQQQVSLPIHTPPPNPPLDLWDIFHKLDDYIRPGVTLEQFTSHFAACECGLITTVRSFPLHVCQGSALLLENDTQCDEHV